MKTLVNNVTQAFTTQYNAQPQHLFHAPGRVNLIGEHTDYNNGFVLPCAIDRGTVLAVSERNDNSIHVIAASLNNSVSQWEQTLPIAKASGAQSWSNYLRGVNEQFIKKGLTPKGMNIVVQGNIPQGAGLSSSASFSVALATTINELNNFGFSPSDIALLCQAAENQFVGCNCGIMDQLISAAGQDQKALLIDCADLSLRPISLPEDAEVIIIDSKVTRGLVDSEYNARRTQCEEAAAIIGINSLRDANMAMLDNAKDKMNEVTYRRARHVITENDRTLTAADALESGNYTVLSKTMEGSHNSMRDDFEITVPQIDFLVSQIHSVLGTKGGVRMTGGGFGGCVVAITPKKHAATVVKRIEDTYTAETGLTAEIHICKASNGAGKLL